MKFRKIEYKQRDSFVWLFLITRKIPTGANSVHSSFHMHNTRKELRVTSIKRVLVNEPLCLYCCFLWRPAQCHQIVNTGCFLFQDASLGSFYSQRKISFLSKTEKDGYKLFGLLSSGGGVHRSTLSLWPDFACCFGQ